MTSYIFAGVPSSTLYQYFLFYYNVMFLKLWIDTSSSSSECVVGGGPLCSLLLSFQSSAALQASRAVKCVTFRTSRYQVHRGLPGFLRQPGCRTMALCRHVTQPTHEGRHVLECLLAGVWHVRTEPACCHWWLHVRLVEGRSATLWWTQFSHCCISLASTESLHSLHWSQDQFTLTSQWCPVSSPSALLLIRPL